MSDFSAISVPAPQRCFAMQRMPQRMVSKRVHGNVLRGMFARILPKRARKSVLQGLLDRSVWGFWCEFFRMRGMPPRMGSGWIREDQLQTMFSRYLPGQARSSNLSPLRARKIQQSEQWFRNVQGLPSRMGHAQTGKRRMPTPPTPDPGRAICADRCQRWS